MGILQTLNKIRANYPGGWKRYAKGYEGYKTPQFVQPTSPDDRRSLIPAMGLKEYWYPAIPDSAVGWKKPVGLKIMGEDIVLFRDTNGEVQAFWDYCPHRGVYLSLGDCFWKGYLSCPYHGATFNGEGECVEFITEGPDSKMVGRLKVHKKYPTKTLKGIVFIWMGDGEPVPIEEDVPPEMFEDHTVVRHAWNYWHCNWMVATENTMDSHNAFWVHRNAVWMLTNRFGGRPRTPIGYKGKVVNNKVITAVAGADSYYEKDGQIPYQMYYPRINGVWPLHRWRLLWSWAFEYKRRWRRRRPKFEVHPEWQGQRLPCIIRLSHWDAFITRWCIPVDENLTRVMYLRSVRPQNKLARFYEWLTWPIGKWIFCFNFSDQDYDAMRTVRYQYPEYLSSTDSYMVAFRKLVVEHGRGIKKTVEVAEETTAERLIHEAESAMGVNSQADTGEDKEVMPAHLRVIR
jgi:phenylpropionate dioxygenase-like ring-hydroxylating dioxygenase large terminal subunit